MTLLIGNRDRIDDCASRQREARSRRFSTRLAHPYILWCQAGADPCRSTSSPVCDRMTPRAPARSRSSGSTGRLGRVRGAAAQSYTRGVVCAKVARYAKRQYHPAARPLATATPDRRKRCRPRCFQADLLGHGPRRARYYLPSILHEPRLPPAAARSRLRLRRVRPKALSTRRHQPDRSHCPWAAALLWKEGVTGVVVPGRVFASAV